MNEIPQTLTMTTDKWWAVYTCTAAGSVLPPEPPARFAITPFSQSDPRWRDERLGTTAQTIGKWGCAMTCACMIFSQIDPNINPSTFNAMLSYPAPGGYNYVNGGEAHLAWDRLPSIFAWFKWHGRQDWKRRLTPEELGEILNRIMNQAPLVLFVDYKPKTAAFDSHFVLATGYSASFDDICILDPIDGQEAWLLERYGAPGHDLERAIWGYRDLRIEVGA
jgi:hypothetical protein